METALHLGSLSSLLALCYQDLKDRHIAVYLIVIALLTTALIFAQQVPLHIYLLHSVQNILIVAFLLAVIWLYARLKFKRPLNEVFGLGDALFFTIPALSFPRTSFLLLFVGSLIFSLVLFSVLRPRFKEKTVPLAGLQALFFAMVLGLNWCFDLSNLYLV